MVHFFLQGTNVTSLVYNDAGQVVSNTFNGLAVTNQFDSLNRRTGLSFSSQVSSLSLAFGYKMGSNNNIATLAP